MVNHSFPHHFGAEPKAGKHSVHKFKLPDKFPVKKEKPFGLFQKAHKTQESAGFPIRCANYRP